MPMTSKEREDAVLTNLLAHLIDQDCCISVHDGESYTLIQSTDQAAIYAALRTADEDKLIVRDRKDKRYLGYIYLAYGNDGHDVICDHSGSTSFCELIWPVDAFAETLADDAMLCECGREQQACRFFDGGTQHSDR